MCRTGSEKDNLIKQCHVLFQHYTRCGVPQCVCISITMLSAEECTTGYLSKQFHLYSFDQIHSAPYTGPVNTTSTPLLDLGGAVSALTSLTNQEKGKVEEAMEASFNEFLQMEDVFNQKRFKRKWVQSTAETDRLGQKNRLVGSLVDAANKSKMTSFQFM